MELVFRTIPGRTYQPDKAVAPLTVIDKPSLMLHDGEQVEYGLPRAGRYRLVAKSEPNGLGVVWPEGTTCNSMPAPGREHKSIDITCNVPHGGAVHVSNPTGLGLGPTEEMSVYIAKLP